MNFSVVIPLYNKERYIRQAIDSVLAQSYQDFEILVVDDVSTDNSLGIVESIHSEKIHIVRHEKNKGLSAARNTGIRNSKADFVVFLDADDYWARDFLERIDKLITKFPEASLFATSYLEVFPTHSIRPKTLLELNDGDDILLTDFFKKNLGQPIYNHSSLAVRKSLFDEVGFYDERLTFSEDVDFGIRANLASPLAYHHGICSFYRAWSENQITGSGIARKTIPMLDNYGDAANRPDVKKYLDFERYVMAMHCKLAGRYEDFRKIRKEINPENLNVLQQVMLALPRPIAQAIRSAKIKLLRKGKRWSTY